MYLCLLIKTFPKNFIFNKVLSVCFAVGNIFDRFFIKDFERVWKKISLKHLRLCLFCFKLITVLLLSTILAYFTEATIRRCSSKQFFEKFSQNVWKILLKEIIMVARTGKNSRKYLKLFWHIELLRKSISFFIFPRSTRKYFRDRILIVKF